MENNQYEIVALPKEQWKGTPIPMATRNDSYYDFEISPLNHDGCTVSIVRKPAEQEIVHTPEEYDFPDGLYQDHWEKAEAYGVVGTGGPSFWKPSPVTPKLSVFISARDLNSSVLTPAVIPTMISGGVKSGLTWDTSSTGKAAEDKYRKGENTYDTD